jgi:flavodoxin
MKALIVYYSRTGITRTVAGLIAKEMKCAVEEIVDEKKRKGAIGYILSGREAMMKSLTTIMKPRYDPSKYDVVIIGTPVWAYKMSCAVRTYLTQNKGKIKKAAFFCTYGGSGEEATYKDMEELVGAPVATLGLKTREVLSDDLSGKIADFARNFKEAKPKVKKIQRKRSVR